MQLIPSYKLIPTVSNLTKTQDSLIPQYDNILDTPGLTPQPATPKQPVYLRPNDPYQINSILDVLFNDEAHKRRYGKSDFSTRFRAGVDLFNDFTLQPIMHGRFLDFGINTLMQFGEVSGVLGNVVKSLFATDINQAAENIDYDTAAKLVSFAASNPGYIGPGGQKQYTAVINNQLYTFTDKERKVYEEIVNSGRTVNPYLLTTSERVKSALGIGNYGQINYNINTGGGWLADMLIEVVADPMTWISLGTAGAAKKVGDVSLKGMKEAIKHLDGLVMRGLASADDVAHMRGILNNLAQEGQERILRKEALEYFRKKSFTMAIESPQAEWIEDLLGKAVKGTAMDKTFAIDKLSKAMTMALYHGTDTAGKMGHTAKLMEELLDQTLQKIPNTMAVKVLPILDNVNKVADTAQSVLNKAALAPTGIYPIVKLVKKVSPHVAGWVVDKLDAAAEPYMNDFRQFSIMSYTDELAAHRKSLNTVSDALDDGDKLLLNSDFEKKYHAQISRDEVFLGDLFEQMQDAVNKNSKEIDSDKFNDLLAQYDDYMLKAHKGATIEQLIQKSLQILKENPDTSLKLTRYIKSLSQYSSFMKELTAKATGLVNSSAIIKVSQFFGTSAAAATHDKIVQRFIKPFTDIIDDITAPLAARDNAVLNILDTIPDMKQLAIAGVKEAVEPIKQISQEAAALVDDMISKVTIVYDIYFTDLEKYVSNFDLEKHPRWTWGFQQSKSIIAGVNNVFNAFEAALKTLESKLSLPETLTLNRGSFSTLIKEYYPGANDMVNKIIDAVEKMGKLTKTSQPAYASADTGDKIIDSLYSYFGGEGYTRLSDFFEDFDADSTLWRNVMQTIDPLRNERFIKYTPESVEELFFQYTTAITHDDYQAAYSRLATFLQDMIHAYEIYASESVGGTRVIDDSDNRLSLLRSALEDLNALSLKNYIDESRLVDSWTILYQLKNEQMYTLSQIMSDKNTIEFATELSEHGNAGIALRDMWKNETNPERKQMLEKLFRPIDQFWATKNFFQRLWTSDVSPETLSGVIASIQKQYKASATKVAADPYGFVTQLVNDVESFIRNTPHTHESLSLDNQFEKLKDEVNAIRRQFGLDAIDKETHVSTDDVMTMFAVLQDLSKSSNETMRLFSENRRIIGIDFESMNSNVPDANMIHQAGIVVWGDKILPPIKLGLQPEALPTNKLPGKEYLNKIFPDLINDDAAQQAAYITSRAGTFADERELTKATVLNLWENVQDTYDLVAKKWKAVFVTHNGKEFDWPLLQAKIAQYRLQTELSDAGVNLAFLTDIDKIDTLLLLQQKHHYFNVGVDERKILSDIIQDYATEMNTLNSNCLFSAFSKNDMQDMRHALYTLLNENSKEQTLRDSYLALSQQLGTLTDNFIKIRSENKAFAKTPYAKVLFEGPLATDDYETVVQKRRLLHDHFLSMGMTDDEIVERFGYNFDNMGASPLLGVQGPYQTIAYKKYRDTDLIDAWFVGSAARIGNLTNLQAQQMHGVAKVLHRISEKVRYIEMYQPHYERMQELVKVMMADERFNYLNLLRTEGLNIQEQWSVFKYMASKYSSADNELLTKIFQASHLDELTPDDFKLWSLLHYDRNADRIKRMTSSEWLKEYISPTVVYASDYNKMLNLWISLDEFSNKLNKNNLFDGGAQLTKKATMPAVNMLEDFTAIVDAVERFEGRAALQAMFDKEASVADDQARHILRGFLNLDADSMLHWLASSDGFYVFHKSDLDIGELDFFVEKLGGESFVSQNIKTADDGEFLWIYLSRDARYKATISNDFQDISYHANGKELKRYDWAKNDLSIAKQAYDFETQVSPPGLSAKFAEADDRLYYLSEGASGSSMWDTFTQGHLQEVFAKMPDEMRKDFYSYEELTAPAMWKKIRFNHSVGGTIANRRRILPHSNTNMVRNVAEATMKKTQDHASLLVYSLAMFDEFSMLSHDSNRIGQIAMTDPGAVVQYFKNHPEYTTGLLVKADNKLGYRLIEIKMNTIANVQRAVRQGARIMTLPEFHKAWEVINNNLYSNTWLSGWQKLVRMYKIGYLSTPGTWMRNAIDSFIKNMAATDSNPIETTKFYYYAVRSLKEYDDVVQDMIGGWGKGRLPELEERMKFFETYPGKMDFERFEYLHKFFNDASAGGEASVYKKLSQKQQADYIMALEQAGNITPDAAKMLRMKRDFYGITSMALEPMNKIERIARLAEYDMLTSRGLSSTKSIAMIEKTHFAYSVKTLTEQTLEMVIPFYTFASRNMNFWLDMLDENPKYFAFLRDVLGPMWNLDQYDPEELHENNGLQSSILSGNIPVFDDYVLKTSFSFMDSLKILTNPIGEFDSRIFAPVQAILNVFMQGASDESYRKGNEMLSNWMQETFGLKVTEEQLRAKYGEWAEEYIKLYPYKVSGVDSQTSAVQKIARAAQFVPLVGTIVSRLVQTGIYYDSDGAKALLYTTGAFGPVRDWDSEARLNKIEKLRMKIYSLTSDSAILQNQWQAILSKYGYDTETNLYALKTSTINSMWQELLSEVERKPALGSQIYEMLQKDDDAVWMYSRIKTALGYGDVPLSKIPDDAKQVIYSVMNGIPTQTAVHPILQDGESIPFMWNNVRQKYGYTDVPFEKIPNSALNKMYLEIAEGAVVAMDIFDMLQNDPDSRYGYAVARNKLGYKGIKLTQIPTDALEVIHGAMVNKLYSPAESHGTSKRPRRKPASTYPDKVYHEKTWTSNTPYDTHKGVYANYGHYQASKNRDPHIYEDLYTQYGTSRMTLMMDKLTPERLAYRIKHMASLMDR